MLNWELLVKVEVWAANYSSSFTIPGGLWIPVPPFLVAEEQQ